MKGEAYVGALDQGTSSTRFVIFNRKGEAVSSHQVEHRQIFPKPGWVEHDPLEILQNSLDVIHTALRVSGIAPRKLVSIGITNQRETTLLWNRKTGEPLANAIVWQDTRTAPSCEALAARGGRDRFRGKTGLPIATYFSGPKIAWVLDNVAGARRTADRGEALFGTMDSWLVWWLTGGPRGGVHLTDVTNASRTMLMDIERLQWDEGLCADMGVPMSALPAIRPSVDTDFFGRTRDEGPLGCRVPIGGVMGDQQAALFGQACFEKGSAKNTYGTGCFMLMNTGTLPVQSQHGLLTTVGFQIRDRPCVYALEGSVAVAGALVQWLRDNLGLIGNSTEVEALALSVEDNGGVYFVPAFSGLFAPRWRSDARGIVAGLTRFANRGHLARAALEATAYQTREVCEAMGKDAGTPASSLKVDGGMVRNDLLMQFQADILNVRVLRPRIAEATAFGAAAAAGIAAGFWEGMEELEERMTVEKEWLPRMPADEREGMYAQWMKAVERSLGWV